MFVSTNTTIRGSRTHIDGAYLTVEFTGDIGPTAVGQKPDTARTLGHVHEGDLFSLSKRRESELRPKPREKLHVDGNLSHA